MKVNYNFCAVYGGRLYTTVVKIVMNYCFIIWIYMEMNKWNDTLAHFIFEALYSWYDNFSSPRHKLLGVFL